MRGSYKIAIGFVVLSVGGYIGKNYYSASQVDHLVFPAIKPGRVTLLGLRLEGTAYRIIVTNQVAQLIKGESSKFEAGQMDESTASDSDSEKTHIPLREFMQTLQGDEKALTELVRIMNEELRKAEIPPNPVIWESKDINAALAGDAKLKAKLVRDIGVGLDGKPTGSITETALMQGIVVRSHIPVKVNVGGELKTLYATVDMPYRSVFTRNLEKLITDKSVGLSDQDLKNLIAGNYQQEANLEAKKNNYEPVSIALKTHTDLSYLSKFAQNPEEICANARVLVNEDFITHARYEEEPNQQDKKLYDIHMELTDEGRKRLWQYSRKNIGAQLLLITDGIAIASPTIMNELSSSDATVTQLPDKGLVEDAIDIMNKATHRAAGS